MFPEIEGGTQMQPKKIGGTWEKSLRTPGLEYLARPEEEEVWLAWLQTCLAGCATED